MVATDSARPRLALHHVTLLQPEAVIEKRLANIDGFVAALKGAANAVISYDTSHPDGLPAELDLVVVARPNRLRCWLVGANGDLVVSELEVAFGRLPKVNARDGNVAAVQTLARAGTSVVPRSLYLPAAWWKAAGRQGSEIDNVIDAS